MGILVEFCQATFIALLGMSACTGLLALASPRAFAAVVACGNLTVLGEAHSTKRWDDIDRFVLRHERLFGLIVVVVTGYLWLISRIGPDSYSNSMLLLIVGIAMSMGLIALRHIKRQSREIEQHLSEAHTDALTGLTNRRLFELEASRRLSQWQRQGTPLCVLIIDLDGFKSINDEFGHVLGDAILKQVAEVLVATARHMDIVGRLGGDEFVVLLPDSDLEAACQVAERLRLAISETTFCFEGSEHSLTISIGLTEAQLDDDVISLLKRSDSALYAAKDAGKNCCYRHGIPEPAVATPAATA